MAVSYTHLDVYKRQVLTLSFGQRVGAQVGLLGADQHAGGHLHGGPALSGNVHPRQQPPAAQGLRRTQEQRPPGAETVSYTHLDVYKRQH